jgi:Spy/CpxP family protein refolding chaperone
MKRMIMTMLAAASVVAGGAAAQNFGYGPGMMRGYGPGYGVAPGEGAYAGVRGYGGMMGGMGFATLPDFAGAGIELTPAQQARIREIQRDARASQWKSMESMHDLMWQGESLYRDGKLDAAAARKRYEAMETLRKQVFEDGLQAAARIDALLTKEQRDKLASASR